MNPDQALNEHNDSSRKKGRSMSLLTRLWLSVLGAMLLVLGVSFAVNVWTARNYLEQQLFAQASDSAASLALSMSQQSKDLAMSQLLVTALFDSGHFESIIYRDVAGQVIAERHTTAPAPTAPGWFVALVPLEARAGESLVSDGWKQAGKVEVRASARYAYGELWAGILKLALTQGLIGLLLCGVVAALMRWLQQPLKAIVAQAEAIGQRRFVTIDEPAVPELRVVGRAMNTMVKRIRDMFAEQAARIESLRQEVTTDSTTGVPNRTLFMGSLRAALSEEGAQRSGLLLLLRMRDLAGLNARLERREVDALLRHCAEALQAVVPAGEREAVVARLNGSEFGLICPGLDKPAAEVLGQNLLERLAALRPAQLSDAAGSLACVGWLIYRHGESLAELLARLDAKVMLAETSAQPIAGGSEGASSLVLSAGDWRLRLEKALTERRFFLVGFPVKSAEGGLLHQEFMLRMKTEEGDDLTAGQFMPPAVRHGMTGRLDLLTLELALEQLRAGVSDVAVNICAQSLNGPDFVAQVRQLLQSAPALAPHLWVEIPERGLVDVGGLARLAGLAEVLRHFNSKLGIEHFGSRMLITGELQESLSLDYFKLDGSFVSEIDESSDKQKFVQSLVEVARALDIKVIAERVSRPEEVAVLARIGVAGMTGPAIKL